MGKKLANAPVYYTVAQVQFNPILNLDSYLPAIQARMREMRFPDYRHDMVQRVMLPGMSVDGAQLAMSAQSRHVFGDMSGRELFLLEANALSFQSTSYETFEQFSKALMDGLEIVHRALDLTFVERIGLRYLDAVFPLNRGETLADYLVQQVLGHALSEDGQLLHSLSETATSTTCGQLLARVFIRHGDVGLPLDLSAMAPVIDTRFTSREAAIHAILDTDASRTEREPFDLEKISGHLTALHDDISRAFAKTVTPHALAVWA